jgi:hypothetical protein
MQFQLGAVFLFAISCMTMVVSASPIPVPAPSPADGLIVRLPESVDSPLASADVEARVLDFIPDSPLAPLDAEARSLADIEIRTPEPENVVAAVVAAPQAEAEERRGCGRWACL